VSGAPLAASIDGNSERDQKRTSRIEPIQEHYNRTRIKKGFARFWIVWYSLLAERLRPSQAIDRSTTQRCGMTAHPLCSRGFAMTFRRIAVFFFTRAPKPLFFDHTLSPLFS
jgi:hypothetical protein